MGGVFVKRAIRPTRPKMFVGTKVMTNDPLVCGVCNPGSVCIQLIMRPGCSTPAEYCICQRTSGDHINPAK